MKIDRSPGKPADPSILVNVAKLVTAYYDVQPDLTDAKQRVVSETSGHRGSAFDGAFNEWHILATQAICVHRKAQKVDGPLFLAMDTQWGIGTCVYERIGPDHPRRIKDEAQAIVSDALKRSARVAAGS